MQDLPAAARAGGGLLHHRGVQVVREPGLHHQRAAVLPHPQLRRAETGQLAVSCSGIIISKITQQDF